MSAHILPFVAADVRRRVARPVRLVTSAATLSPVLSPFPSFGIPLWGIRYLIYTLADFQTKDDGTLSASCSGSYPQEKHENRNALQIFAIA